MSSFLKFLKSPNWLKKHQVNLIFKAGFLWFPNSVILFCFSKWFINYEKIDIGHCCHSNVGSKKNSSLYLNYKILQYLQERNIFISFLAANKFNKGSFYFKEVLIDRPEMTSRGKGVPLY